MRILGVRLVNIRSYVNRTIVFPPSGITVIYGDNGTGKTSILLGINYALFGLPRGQKSSDPFAGFVSPYKDDLLRAGASSAMVRLLLNHKGKLILIERRLNGDRGGEIAVFGEVDGTLKVLSRRRFSSEELTMSVLDLLGLREDPRKGRNTYIFSNVMYVPQFNIHQTLVLDDKQRRELVDKVLGLDKYMAALTNIEKIAKGKSSVIGRELENVNSSIKDREGYLKKIDVDGLKARLRELRGRDDELRKKLSGLQARRGSLMAEKERLDNAINELNRKVGELEGRIRDIEKKERTLISKRRELSRILSEAGLGDIEGVSKLIEELRGRRQSLVSEDSRVGKDLERLDRELEEVDKGLGEALVRMSRLEAEIENTKSRVREIWREVVEMRNVVAQGMCPLCKQPIIHEHGEELVREKIARMREASMMIVPLVKDLWFTKLLYERCNNEKEDVKKKRGELIGHRDRISRELREIEALILKLEQAVRLQDEISELEKEVVERAKVLEDLSNSKARFEEYSRMLDRLKAELNSVIEDEFRFNRELGEVSKNIDNLEEELKRYSELRDELRRLEAKASVLTKARDYLDHIYRGVETIESAVRSLAHERFKEYFQEYFVKLLEDQELVEASVSDFKPTIRIRTGVTAEHEISQPSGAQLIALGLAYRLALNRVVRDLNKELRDSVLIMDEPTLGFSPERIEKLRELIEFISNDLGEAQAILVTHDERLLEAGDCRIRLFIDRLKNETQVSYEERLMRDGGVDFQSYERFVSNILSK